MGFREILYGGSVYEFCNESFLGGVVCIPYQFSFGFSLRVYDGKPGYRIYIGSLKIWAMVLQKGEVLPKCRVNKLVDW